MGDGQATMYEFGDFRIDAAKRLLFKSGGEVVPLTPKVFDTLLYLVENRGTVLTKDELLAALWPDTVVEENNLGQNISKLRGVLGESRGEHSYILTVPGRGYRFVADVKTLAAGEIVPSAQPVKSIALLPFKPLLAEHRDAALELGMADTLIARLSNIREVLVRPISSVRKYVELEQDPLAAGRELGVESVVDGSIQRWGDHIRVTVRLMRVSDGASLWAGIFDEKFTDIFNVQDEITLAVVDALKLKLLGNEEAEVLKRYTDNPEAYQLYLKGRYFWFKFNPEGLAKARDCFELAIQKDPNFVLAYSGLADALQASAVFKPSAEIYPKAMELTRKALTLDSSIAEVWTSKAAASLFYEWDWAGAESDCKRSIELNPRYLLAHDLYSVCLLAQGRFEDAIRKARIACELDPFSTYFNASLGCTLYFSRRYDEATDQLLKALKLDPANLWALMWLVDLYEQRQMYAAALNCRQKLLTVGGNNELAVEIGHEFQRSGYEGVLQKTLDDLEIQSKFRYVSPLDFAAAYVRLGEGEIALDWLERAFTERTMYFCFLKVSPAWESLHSNQRYQQLVRRIGLKPDQLQSGSVVVDKQ